MNSALDIAKHKNREETIKLIVHWKIELLTLKNVMQSFAFEELS